MNTVVSELKQSFKPIAASVILALASTLASQAAINISFVESLTNVVATFSGSYDNQPSDIGDWTFLSNNAPGNGVHLYGGSDAGFGVDFSTSSSAQYFIDVTSVAVSGTVPWSTVTSGGVTSGGTNSTGFHFYNGSETLTYYTRGNTDPSPVVAATATYAGFSLNDLGFDAGEILEGSGSFSLVDAFTPSTVYETVNWSVTAVPEPGEYAALAGVAMLGFVAYRRRKVVKA